MFKLLKNRSMLLVLLLATGLSFGCATTYQVRVNGYTDPAAPAPIPASATFFVIENKEAKNPLLEKEIKAKINLLLERRGYVLVPFDKADYYLFFTYGIGPTSAVSVVMPDYPWGLSMEYGYYYPRSYFFYWPGFAYYPAYVEPLYDRWLLLNVVEGKHYRETGQFRTLWVGESRSTGTSADIREVINSLLLAAFAQFGKNTGKAVTVDVKADDPRLLELQITR